MLVYMCACRLRLCVRSGLRLRLTHHLSRPPPPCPAGGGCRRCVGDFSRRGRMPPWGGRLPVEPAGLPPRHPGAPTLWLSEVPPSGSPLPFSGWRPRLSLRWFSWGSRALGVSGCLGPGSFPCLLHALRDGAVVPHTHY